MTSHAKGSVIDHPPQPARIDPPLIGHDFADSTFSPAAIRRAALAMVVLGVAIRIIRYAMHFPLWADEAMLAENFRAGSYTALLDPLRYQQVAPILYLWTTQSLVNLLGYHEYTLRLLSCIAAVASVPLFYGLAKKILTGGPLLIAVTIFAVAYYPVRYAAEAKPYALDLFIALCLTSLAVAWLLNPKKGRYLWALAIASPLAVGFSFPAIFIAGGIGLALLGKVIYIARHPESDTTGHTALILPFTLFGVLTLAAFVANYLFIIKTQYASSTDATLGFWEDAFPPLTDPLGLFKWFFLAHTGRMFGYPVGESDGGSTLTFICFVIGIYAWWKVRKTQQSLHLLAVLLLPFVLLFIAAAMQRYPYGGSGRIFQHLAPAICLLAGTGGGALVLLGKKPPNRRRAVIITTAVLLIFGLGQGVQSVGWPYRYAADEEDRAFAKRLWNDIAQQHNPEQGPLLCAVSDLDLAWAGQTNRLFDGAKYLCNQTLHAPRDFGLTMPPPDTLTAKLRIVAPYWEPATDNDNDTDTDKALAALFKSWLAEMSNEYLYLGHTDHLREREHQCNHSNGGWIRVHEFETKPLMN